MSERGEVEVDGLRIAYERAGDGPPLVLLHGYVGDGRSTFARQLEELSSEFTVVAWDGPGAGRSADPPESYRLGDFADRLAGFVRALELDRPHVLGMSFGGGLALELYRRHPALPRTLILASSYAGWAGSLPADEVQRRLRQAVDLAGLPPERFVREIAPTLFSSSAPRDAVDAFAASATAFHPAGLRAMARSIAEADLRDVLPGVDVPVLLVYGDRDGRAPVAVGEALRAAIPGARLVVLAGVGHVSCVEAPERFNAEVRGFLRSAGV
ncbi:MAG TPA: alpha/beta hydrolase [Solirubrobacteraceae bacterium]|nr:alpha/beta hydrolase [Solirubrobacteraceae bacterium]